MYSIKQLPLGFIQTNCYIVTNDNKQCLIFDPGGDAERLIKELSKMNVKPLAILLTHAHFDHIGAVDVVREKYNIPVYIHEKEQDWLSDPMKNGSGKYAELPNIEMKAADVILTNENVLEIEGFQMQIFHTPGHSPGSVTYFFVEDRIAIVGDVLFKGSIGRADLFGGDSAQLMKSLHTHLLSLPTDTLCYSGHGDVTTIEDEMESNPFLNGFSI